MGQLTTVTAQPSDSARGEAMLRIFKNYVKRLIRTMFDAGIKYGP